MDVVSRKVFLKNQKGFTFIELLFVIMIIGLLASLVFPNAAEIIAKQKLESNTKEVVSHLRRAQQIAISKETTVTVKFLGRKYCDVNIYAYSDLDWNMQLPEGIEFDESQFARSGNFDLLDFKPTGRPVNPGRVKLVDSKNNSLYIYISKFGRIRISEKFVTNGEFL